MMRRWCTGELKVFLGLWTLQDMIGKFPLLLSETAYVRIAVSRGCWRYSWRQNFLQGEVRCVVTGGHVGAPVIFVFFLFTLTFVALSIAGWLAPTVVFGLFVVCRAMYEAASI
jgi:hypothetical protein